MTAAAALVERLAPAAADGARAERGRAWLAEHGLPTSRDEAWRYTPVDQIVAALTSAWPAPDVPARAVDRATVDRLAGDLGGPRLVLVNGELDVGLSDLDGGLAGLWLGGVERLRDRSRPGDRVPGDEPVDGFHALNWIAGRDVAAVLVAPEATVEVPVHVVHLAVGSAASGVATGTPVGPAPGAVGGKASVAVAVHPRTVVRVGAGGRLHVVETYVGLGGPAVVNASTRIVVDEQASVTHHRVAAASRVVAVPPGDVHVGRTGVELGARSSVRSTSVTVGGDVVRNAVDVRFGGEGAEAELDGLDRSVGRQRHDTVVTVDHAASRGRSAQRFKSIVADHGRSSFSGHVIVRPGTVGTDAEQSNPNLVLAPTAQADTRPWLEIFADDVRCAHGATVGRLDEDALFYLRSRGIPGAEARAVLIDAFAAEIVDRATPTALRDHLAGLALHRAVEAR